ncbi:hypothetical protein 189ceduo_00017 [Lactococcus phage STA189]|nr:hypothetical protein 135ceduo_00017 [Lactococcus phage STA135]WLW38871.1 hypothetical protein 189ceduo_00017 [Lactococcus phage STA189]WLW38909.1 hypothetical protein 206ceduo_00017 [Lactococcus phage STA206]
MNKPFEVSYKFNTGVIFRKECEFLGNALENYELLAKKEQIKEIIITYLPTHQIVVKYDRTKQKEYRKWTN